MNLITIIIITVIGITIGYLLAQRKVGGLISKQGKNKKDNKQKILNFLRENRKIQNNDVEKLSGVSNATAERYLNELEKEGKLTQHGKFGQNVFYTLK